ncbi:MAG: SpoIIE family protein phosphatase [Spirochaetes bacterium]|nr:SpoIIE family protein phosphatase [Spirochaetota bacterium]
MTIKYKILILCLLSLFILSVLIYITTYFNLENIYNLRIETLRNDQLKEKKQYLNELVNFANLIIEETYTDSLLLIEKAKDSEAKTRLDLEYKNKAKNFLSALRYDEGNGFFFAYELKNDDVYYAFHGIKFNLWDKVAEAFDRHGSLYRKEIISIAKKGGGYVGYVSEKPSTKLLTEKISYAKYFKPWKWIIVSGIFTDDIKAKVDVLKEQLEKEKRNLSFLTGVISLIIMVIVTVIIIIISNRITKPLEAISNHALVASSEGNLSIFRTKKELNIKTEVGKLVSSFNIMVKAVMKAQDTLKEQERLKKEMEIAEKIQTAIVPVPPLHDELEISAVMCPAKEVGGDYYDIMFDNQKNLWFAIGDVSGHGVTPGLIMMMAQTSFSTNISERGNISPKEAIISVNSLLCENIRNRLKESHFMTMNFLKYLGKGKFIQAGSHLDIIIYRNKTKKCELIKTQGVFLGIVPDVTKAVTDSTFYLDKDDLMLLYTDGIIEARNKVDRKLMGMNKLQEMIIKYFDKDIKDIQNNILEKTLDWCGHNQDDDITMIIVKKK